MGGQMSRAQKIELLKEFANAPDKKGGFLITKGRPQDQPYYKKMLAERDKPVEPLVKRGSGFFDDVKNKYKEIKDKGAAYLTGTNYVGPFNRLDEEYLRTNPPTDLIDEGAMRHDLEYSRIAKLRKAGTPKAEIERLIRVSDDAFLDNIKKHWRTNPRAAAMGYAGIKGKNVVEDTVGLDRNLFVGEGMKKRKKLIKKLVGSGFFGDLYDSAKQFASKAVERVKQTGESVMNVFRGKAPRLDLPPPVRRLLEAYGNRPIVRMFVRRDPIESAINTALNVISMGSWNSLKQKYGYDTFYHLQLEVIVRVSDTDDTNARFVLQKNEVIDVSPAKPRTDKTEMVEVPMAGGHTMNSLLSNAKQTMGEKFYYYDAFHNNCQDFVGALLVGSGLLGPDIAGFIKQPVDQLVKEISFTDRVARGITDLGGIVDVGLQGKGGLNPSDAFAAQLKAEGVSPSEYLEKAKKNAKARGLAASMLGFSSDEKHKLQIPNAEGKIVRFGAVKKGDYILYTLQKSPEAEKHRKSYLARATKIKGDWAKDPYSPNSLAIGILWEG